MAKKRFYIKNIDADNIDVCNHLLKLEIKFSLIKDTFILRNFEGKEIQIEEMIKEFDSNGKTIILNIN
jgi:hypothetical protein